VVAERRQRSERRRRKDHGERSRRARHLRNNPPANVGYRNNATKGLAKNDEPEAMYMVVVPRNASVTGWTYATGMLKGPSGNAFGLKAGNAQSAALQTKWNGSARPGTAR
jgi:hypothetical protein